MEGLFSFLLKICSKSSMLDGASSGGKKTLEKAGPYVQYTTSMETSIERN